MITKNISGISYWKIKATNIIDNKIEVHLNGYLNENDEERMKLFVIDCDLSIINNISDYNNLINEIENFIINNVEEFKN